MINVTLPPVSENHKADQDNNVLNRIIDNPNPEYRLSESVNKLLSLSGTGGSWWLKYYSGFPNPPPPGVLIVSVSPASTERENLPPNDS
ncbi:hypothetical protein Pan241w_13150 [Gimesia alba]|uniref:Uncharacterized protein n=1 Tax=Gimesia alba TaxID=2527973 RepID=A0A517RBL6_9PLAN|nr:hypothetical protein Pan241w_13150 [Gimesia alba]